ncbi:TetR/AcrR family transcriptional regulator [Streptomyces alkaliterrae]|nr:TetR/AcrR family transcriptional regulator [Streptomyces alkaliterrae]
MSEENVMPVRDTTGTARRSRRSKITPERERELYDAVLDLLREVGYDALTMDAVATRTKSSKATLYRQWGSKPQLVVAALDCCGAAPPPFEELEAENLVDSMRELARWAARDAAKDTALMRAVGQSAQNDPELARAMRETVIEPELNAFRGLLEKAVQRGELAEVPPAADYLPHMFFGLLFARPAIDMIEVDEDYLVGFVDEVAVPLLGLTDTPPPTD